MKNQRPFLERVMLAPVAIGLLIMVRSMTPAAEPGDQSFGLMVFVGCVLVYAWLVSLPKEG